jgi:hypothetical protein
MKKLLLFLFLLPLIAQAQVNGTIQRTAATGIVRYFNSGAAGIDTLVNAGIGTNGFVPVYNSTLKKSVWTNPSTFSPTISFGTFGSTPNAQGGSYSAGVITLQPASASFPGGVTTGTQTFAGAKTFNDQILANTSSAPSAIQASSTNSGGRVITLLGNSSLEPLAIVQQGSGMLAAFGTSDGMTYTDKALIRNNGSIYTRGQLEVGNLQVGAASDSVMVHRSIDGTVRRVPTTGTVNAVFSASPTLSGTVTVTGTGTASTITGNNIRTSDGVNVQEMTLGKLSYANASAGTQSILFQDPASSTILDTLPATSGTITLNNLAQTLRNKTIVSPTITGSGTFTGTSATLTNTSNALNTILSVRNADAGSSAITGLNIGNDVSANAVTMRVTSSTGTGTGQFELMQQQSKAFILGTGGNPAITMSSALALRFHAYGAGTLTTDASGNVTATSDSTWKEQFKPFTRGLAALYKLKPVKYHWTKESGLDTLNEYTYFKAQDVQNDIPEAVFPARKGQPLGIQDRPIIATLVNAVNELSAIIEAEKKVSETRFDLLLKQQAIIDNLEKRITLLEKQ